MSVIDEYLMPLDAPQKAALEEIRTVVHGVAPEAEEAITYGIPGFKYKGKYLTGFAAFKQHLSFFPSAAPIEALSGKLTSFKTSKGTIQFTPKHPIPKALIKELISLRKAAIDGE